MESKDPLGWRLFDRAMVVVGTAFAGIAAWFTYLTYKDQHPSTGTAVTVMPPWWVFALLVVGLAMLGTAWAHSRAPKQVLPERVSDLAGLTALPEPGFAVKLVRRDQLKRVRHEAAILVTDILDFLVIRLLLPPSERPPGEPLGEALGVPNETARLYLGQFRLKVAVVLEQFEHVGIHDIELAARNKDPRNIADIRLIAAMLRTLALRDE